MIISNLYAYVQLGPHVTGIEHNEFPLGFQSHAGERFQNRRSDSC